MGVFEGESFSHIPVNVGPTYGPINVGTPGSNIGVWRAGDLYTQKQTFTDPATGKVYNIVGWGGTDQFGNPIPILQDPQSSTGGMFYARRNPMTGEYAGVESVPMGVGGQVYMPGFGPGAGYAPPPTAQQQTAQQTPAPKTAGGVPPSFVIAVGAATAIGIATFMAVKKGWIRIPKLR